MSNLVSVEVVDPGVPVGALSLTAAPLPLVSLVLELTLVLLPAAPGGPVAEVASNNGAVVDGVEGLGVTHPVDELLTCDKVNIRESKDAVNELEESILPEIS